MLALPPLPDVPDLTIRPARARDRMAVGRLLERSYSELLTEDYPTPILAAALPLMTRANPELLMLPTYFVALCGGEVVAVGGWSATLLRSGQGAADVGHVRHVACDPDWLRRGVTRAVMEQSFDSARVAGIRLLSCLSTRTAAPFYRSLGFEVVGEVELRMGPGVFFPVVEMRKLL
ncbi:GNAT family N-acetyltransferase [Rhodobacteraceae bacterium D3-12]|nr:GNAT family N-acetyltransferase [Rhodobacteraceae bacterium D3-12]